MNKEKIILDTDIGSDIDDAVALAYLLQQSKCDLLGITTVSGAPVERAMMCSALCQAVGRKDIPIYPGCENPLLRPNQQPKAQQAEALTRMAHATQFPMGQAIPFLRDMIRSNPGEITLLAIGPLTNLGVLFAQDPELPSLLKRLVLMCGVFTTQISNTPICEWNALVDPHATAMVYNAQAKVHRSIGLDVTLQVHMTGDEVRAKFQKGILKVVLEFAEVWFRECGRMVFHDPLAAVTIFDDSLCGFDRGHVSVELTSDRFAGYTAFHGDANGKHEVAMRVNAGKFFEHYFSVF